jgi:hypothetical protein
MLFNVVPAGVGSLLYAIQRSLQVARGVVKRIFALRADLVEVVPLSETAG